MIEYNADIFQRLYARYLRSPRENLLGDILMCLEGLIDSVIYGKFNQVKVIPLEDLKQEAYVFLIPFIRNKSVNLKHNYTSFVYRCVYHHLVDILKKETSHDTLRLEESIGVGIEDPHSSSKEFITKGILEYVKEELYKVHNLFRIEEGKEVCKFICHYYVGKKSVPSLQLVQEKFPKNNELDTIYSIAVADIRTKVLQLRKTYSTNI